MSRYRTNPAVQVEPDEAEDVRYDDEETAAEDNNEEEGSRGVDCPGDHVGVSSRPYLMKILEKQGNFLSYLAQCVLNCWIFWIRIMAGRLESYHLIDGRKFAILFEYT